MKHGGVSTYNIMLYMSHIIFPFMVPYPIIHMFVYNRLHKHARTHVRTHLNARAIDHQSSRCPLSLSFWTNCLYPNHSRSPGHTPSPSGRLASNAQS